MKSLRSHTLACEKNKQGHSQLHTPPGCEPMSLSEVHPPTLAYTERPPGDPRWPFTRSPARSHSPVHLWLFLCLLFFALSFFPGRAVSSETHFIPQKEFSCPTMWSGFVFCFFLQGARMCGGRRESNGGGELTKTKVTIVIIKICTKEKKYTKTKKTNKQEWVGG